ncbi:MAG: hypothetical protein AB7N54_08510 [Alphaproteobacteria bacterium]
MATVETLEAIVELQRAELTRLLRERDRLEARVERLFEQAEREQVLRQQMQATIDRLVANAAAQKPVAIADESETARRLAASERRYRALAGAVGQLVVVLGRRRTGRGTA